MQYYITSHFIKLFVFGFAKYEVCYVVYWPVCVCRSCKEEEPEEVPARRWWWWGWGLSWTLPSLNITFVMVTKLLSSINRHGQNFQPSLYLGIWEWNAARSCRVSEQCRRLHSCVPSIDVWLNQTWQPGEFVFVFCDGYMCENDTSTCLENDTSTCLAC